MAIAGVKIAVLTRFGFDMVGVTGTILKLGALIGALGSGFLADRMTSNKALYGVVTGGITGVLFFVMSADAYVANLGAFLLAVSFSSTYPLLQVLIQRRTTPETFAAMNGAFHTYSTAGMLSGLLASTFLEPSSGLLLGASGLVVGIISLRIYEGKQIEELSQRA